MRIKKQTPYIRLSLEELSTLIPFLKQKRIAKNLENKKAIPMANLYECLMDEGRTLPKRKFTIFDMSEDIGVKMLQIGTTGGGYYGPYRCFRINFLGNEYIAGIGMNRFLNKVRSIICVTLQAGEEGKPHHSLQLAVDDYMEVTGNWCTFTHRGAIGLGSLGTGKIEILREKYVRPLYPTIIDDDKYFLGKLPANKLWHLDDKIVIQFVENLISYAIVRDIYREDAKKAAGLI